MERDRMSIVMVAPCGKRVKSLNFKVLHIKIAVFTLIGFSLMSLSSFMSTYIFYKKANHKRELSNQLISRVSVLNRGLIESQVVKENLEEKIKDIEGKLLEMQELLAKKGIKKELSVGGDFITADRLSMSYVDFMEKDIDEFFSLMKSFPVGTPLSGKITSGFGYRKDPFNSRPALHSGVDIDATYGQSVVATADGVVDHSGWQKGYGKTVLIKHKVWIRNPLRTFIKSEGRGWTGG
ncbi:MAG: M23 family metallopeptidase [Deltaproteobacteria bacterium]|nr:M23 family metallopeptidase [Deltaproteobacteria bacterium]